MPDRQSDERLPVTSEDELVLCHIRNALQRTIDGNDGEDTVTPLLEKLSSNSSVKAAFPYLEIFLTRILIFIHN